MADMISSPRAEVQGCASITLNLGPGPGGPRWLPAGLALDESAEALGEVGDTAADGTMRVPAYVPVIGEVFAVMTYLLASMGTLP